MERARLKETDDLSWYARRAARGRPQGEGTGEDEGRLASLVGRLLAAGAKGDPASMTFYTKRLPPGCRGCLAGRGGNVAVTTLCTRECSFCFNPKPRTDELVVHGIPVKTAAEGAEIVRRFGLRSVGLSGGEPLLRLPRVLELIRELKALPRPPRVDLYTNGDLASETTLGALKKAGLDAIRFDLAANGYDTRPVRRALRFFTEVAVEMPVIADHAPEQRRMVLDLDALKVPFLNLHELFVCTENKPLPLAERAHDHLLWRPAAGALEAALELMLFAAGACKTTSAYLCSCGTQELIAKRGYRRRAKN